MQTKFATALVRLAALVLALAMPVGAISAPWHFANPTIVVTDKRTTLKEYYARRPLQGYQNNYIGDFEMCVKIFHSRDRGYVSVWNFMPDSEQYLVISVLPLHKRLSGKLLFKFEDGFGNEGVGSVEYPDAHHVRVDLKATKKTDSPPDRNILRQYGANVLPEATCPAERNPETFGGGKALSPPEH